MFKKILVANRGEVALRIMRACKELGVETVAVYSTEDENTYPVRYADEKVCIGPAPANQSYLVMSSIIAAAINTGAEAIHPGYGFLAENADFARACADNDIVFIGPSPESIESMGNKAAARDTMKACGVPTVPGSDGVVETVEEARSFANAVGYPVLVKASAGGGGKGMREVHDPALPAPGQSDAPALLQKLVNNASCIALPVHGEVGEHRAGRAKLRQAQDVFPNASVALAQIFLVERRYSLVYRPAEGGLFLFHSAAMTSAKISSCFSSSSRIWPFFLKSTRFQP